MNSAESTPRSNPAPDHPEVVFEVARTVSMGVSAVAWIGTVLVDLRTQTGLWVLFFVAAALAVVFVFAFSALIPDLRRSLGNGMFAMLSFRLPTMFRSDRAFYGIPGPEMPRPRRTIRIWFFRLTILWLLAFVTTFLQLMLTGS